MGWGKSFNEGAAVSAAQAGTVTYRELTDPGNDSDLSQLDEVEKACFSDPMYGGICYTREHFSIAIANPELCSVSVAVQNGRIIGSVLAARFNCEGRKFCNIGTIAVLENFRGRGIAAGLMGMAEQFARATGEAEMTLQVSEKNTSAMALYHRLGYVIVGVKENYYGENNSAYEMSKIIAAPARDRKYNGFGWAF